ncbi:glycoside hydrolase family 88 protein [Amycolatopsis sp. H20-H5]|uniref:glycoside hydrolase family 88 protein n=1 Tax=Amycolatopsis sp. H20-H5 TaxID=3046309 RepID=UPI002DBBCEB3|nr:glycoside hydrolase family 88 protein [Amycolatopsis sp. H20-H5]MEC3977625.1 glycoside hydrolase family 88 protein [Amycolatopsis sp. H20-H5]
MIVVVLQVTNSAELSRRQAAAALALSLALAIVSKHAVEDPFRRGRAKNARRLRGAYVLGATLVAVTVVSAAVPQQYASGELDRLASATRLDDTHPGALALDPDHPRAAPADAPLMPDPAVAGTDWPLNDQAAGCTVYDIEHWPPSGDKCAYGPQTAPKTIVIVGDSHAVMFTTVFARFVREHPQWRVKMMLRNGCPFTANPPAGLTVCADQNQAELAGILAMKPDLVVTSAMSPESYDKDLKWRWESREQAVDGYEALLKRISDGGMFHATGKVGQLWADGVFMAQPFLALYGKTFGDGTYSFEESAKNVIVYFDHLKEPAKGLLYHAYDEDGSESWASGPGHHSKYHWARAIGWLGMAAIDLLEVLPAGHPRRARLIDVVRFLAVGYQRYQDPKTGRWYQLVDRGADQKNWLETSASAMYTFTLSRGVQRGYLDPQYQAVAEKGYAGVLDQVSIGSDGLTNITNICEGTNVGDTSYYYGRARKTNDLHGLGAFLIMNEQVAH